MTDVKPVCREELAKIFKKLNRDGHVIEKMVIITVDGAHFVSDISGTIQLDNEFCLSELVPHDESTLAQGQLNYNATQLLVSALLEYLPEPEEGSLYRKLLNNLRTRVGINGLDTI